ncbi:uncharacterized protein PHACADRAFT_249236 [Phanerochaete carnosa HHB-10118-sp]|uniref:Uncharacterized protein n=1 Tax=Phanerochaete carnosa (strain HHB-10118-sp) TaxID=650164 RepID=K5V8C4_PHACS|nr:uncharacterized protein PHACADRAFT_249236 [Phanerochaete carnosa HHB-10118-sp]EKM59056.1 hypothetical protein PHACADRAFT_249236 [Phanerochaete carnosa HHB-10118-sp]
MEDVISHEHNRTFARRIITAPDLAKWPGITLDGAGRSEDGQVFIGPTEAEAQSFKLKRLAFFDSRDPSRGRSFFASSADGKLLAASFEGNDILVWRLSDGLLVQRLHHQGHTDEVSSLSFSPIDYTLVSGSKDKAAIVWNIQDGRVLLRLEGHNGPITMVAYAPNGALIATHSVEDESVKVWNAATGECLHTFSFDEEISEFAISADNSRLCAKKEDSCLIYDLHTCTHIAMLRHHVGENFRWSISHQKDRIVTTVNPKPSEIKIWSMVTGEDLLTINPPKDLSSSVAFSPDGTEILTTCKDGTATTYDSRTGQPRRAYNLPAEANCVAYSPNGDYLAFRPMFRPLQVYDTKSAAFLAELKVSEGEGYAVEDLQFLSDNQTLLTKFDRGPLLLYNVQDVLRLQ